jgi:hypothetical protein
MSLESEIGKFGTFRKDYGWQKDSIETFMRSIDIFYSKTPGQFQRAFLNEVSPSGGKTVFSMKLAQRMIEDGLIDRAVWCVPRDSIKIGFGDDARHVTMAEGHRLLGSQFIRIDTDLDAHYAGQLRNYHGLALTYQALPKRLEYLGLLAAKYRLMFFFDEVHHGATGDVDEAMNEWARAMDACRSIAHAVVCMTGTPLRSDAKQVVFVNYDPVTASDGRCGFQVRPDFSFPYSKAVTAGVARKSSAEAKTLTSPTMLRMRTARSSDTASQFRRSQASIFGRSRTRLSASLAGSSMICSRSHTTNASAFVRLVTRMLASWLSAAATLMEPIP